MGADYRGIVHGAMNINGAMSNLEPLRSQDVFKPRDPPAPVMEVPAIPIEVSGNPEPYGSQNVAGFAKNSLPLRTMGSASHLPDLGNSPISASHMPNPQKTFPQMPITQSIYPFAQPAPVVVQPIIITA